MDFLALAKILYIRLKSKILCSNIYNAPYYLQVPQL